MRFGLDELALAGFRQRWVRALVRVKTVGRRLDAPRGARLRMALERLGPIFVIVGSVLSTPRVPGRHDHRGSGGERLRTRAPVQSNPP